MEMLGTSVEHAVPRGSTIRILVLDEDDRVANTIAACVEPGCCEIIVCRDIAAAEAATDLAQFDLIVASPDSTGIDGVEGLAAAEFLAARCAGTIATFMFRRSDSRLRRAAEQAGMNVLSETPSRSELNALFGNLRAPVGLQSPVSSSETELAAGGYLSQQLSVTKDTQCAVPSVW